MTFLVITNPKDMMLFNYKNTNKHKSNLLIVVKVYVDTLYLFITTKKKAPKATSILLIHEL